METIDRDVGLLRGVDCDILAQGFNMIDRMHILIRYIYFFCKLNCKEL
jgi:hypothetical protein